MGVRKTWAAGDDDCGAGAHERIIFEFKVAMGMVVTVVTAVMEVMVVSLRAWWCW